MVYQDGNMGVICYGSENFRTSFRQAIEAKFDPSVLIDFTDETFSNKELYTAVDENVRRRNIYVVMNFTGYDDDFDPNIPYMRLFITNDALMRARAGEINDVLPFMPYLRQERKDRPRSPISAALFAKLLKASGATSLTTVDMHTAAIEGFYDMPVNHLSAMSVIGDRLVEGYDINADDWVLVSPDAGSMQRTRDMKAYLSQKHNLDLRIAMTEKTHGRGGETEVTYVVGDVNGLNVIQIDELIDTAGTSGEGATKLRTKGARDIIAGGTHGLFSRKKDRAAEDRIRDAGIKVISTDSIPRSDEFLDENKDWLDVVSLGPLTAEAIYRDHKGDSVSSL